MLRILATSTMCALLAATLVPGCLAPEPVKDPPAPLPAVDAPRVPDEIQWFPASNSGAPGNRLTLARAASFLALDDPSAPWTIEVAEGPSFERSSFIPEAEPWNLVAARGPRGPILAYRSPDFDMHVAEWNGTAWVQGHLVPAPGELFGYPHAIAGSADELILGFPVIASVGPARYSLLRLRSGVPANLADAERLDFEASPLAMGHAEVQGNRIAVTVAPPDGGVDLRVGTWADLARAPPVKLPGPPSATPGGLYSSVAFDGEGNVAVGITTFPLIGGFGTRAAVLHDLATGTMHRIETDMLELHSGQAIAATWTTADGHHIGLLQNGEVSELGRAPCSQVVVLPDGLAVSLARQEGAWVSRLHRLPDFPTCRQS